MQKSSKNTSSLLADKEESLSSTLRDRMRYNSFMQAYQGPMAEHPNISEKDLLKSLKKNEGSPYRRKEGKLTEEGVNKPREENSIEKDRRELCSVASGDSGLFVSPRPNSALDNSLHDDEDDNVQVTPASHQEKRTKDIGNSPMKPVNFSKLEGMNLISRIPAMHHRPLSARKRVKTTSITKIVSSSNEENINASQEFSLQTRRIMVDQPSDSKRLASSNRSYSIRQDESYQSHVKERPSANVEKSMLTVEGQQYMHKALNPKFRPRTASTGKFRSLDSTEGLRHNASLNVQRDNSYVKKPTIMECLYSIKSKNIKTAGSDQGHKSVIESWITKGGYKVQKQQGKDKVRLSVPFKEFTF